MLTNTQHLTGVAALMAMPDDLPFATTPPASADNRAAVNLPMHDDVDGGTAAPTTPPLPAALARTFMLAGNATFTLVSNASGKRFTFKLRRPKADSATYNSGHKPGRTPVFVSVLSGPDNDNDYAYLGQLWIDAEKITYDVGRKSRVAADAPSQQAARWLSKALNNPALLAQCTVHHAGKCGRCGRTLTVPSSVESGIGPECATRM